LSKLAREERRCEKHTEKHWFGFRARVRVGVTHARVFLNQSSVDEIRTIRACQTRSEHLQPERTKQSVERKREVRGEVRGEER